MHNYACTTQVPNALFDQWMRDLTLSELKVLLLVIRQTWGWVADKSGRRKTRDWLSCSRIETRTGLSKRAISTATKALVRRGLLVVTDGQGFPLNHAHDRRGRTHLYYALAYPQAFPAAAVRSANVAELDQQRLPTTKPTLTKPRMDRALRADGIPMKGSYAGPMSGLLLGAIHPKLMHRLMQNSPQPEGYRSDG